MRDTDAILSVLSDGKPHHIQELYDRIKPGRCNWACRSRISELRRKLAPSKKAIVSRISSDGQAIYQLIDVVDIPKKEGEDKK